MSIPPPAGSLSVAPAALTRARHKLRVLQGGRTRARTIAGDPLTRDEQLEARFVSPEVDRPLTRGDCFDMERPCPFVSCFYHLYLDINEKTGAIKLNFPHLEVWELKESCALDIADRGGGTLDDVAFAINVTRERVRQIQLEAFVSMGRANPAFSPGDEENG